MLPVYLDGTEVRFIAFEHRMYLLIKMTRILTNARISTTERNRSGNYNYVYQYYFKQAWVCLRTWPFAMENFRPDPIDPRLATELEIYPTYWLFCNVFVIVNSFSSRQEWTICHLDKTNQSSFKEVYQFTPK